MRKVYSVSGTSKVKPTDLPKGLKVEETKVKIKETVQTRLNRRLTISEMGDGSPVHLRLEETPATARIFDTSVVEAIFNREEATQIRDLLTEILEGQALRKVTDNSGVFPIWFEIAPDKFVNETTKEKAQQEFDSGYGTWDLATIRSEWGIRSIENQ